MDHFVSFVECTSNNLAIERQFFLDVGMWQDVLGDGPTLWGDVDFGYRAWKKGFQFLRVSNAQLYHRDHTIVDLQFACKRAYHSSRTVHLLFQRHPEIARYLPAFWDKHPMSVFRDPPSLTARKVFRIITSSLPALRAMKHLVRCMETTARGSFLLVILYRWMISAHMYKGYRQGLRELYETKREAPYQLSPSK